MKLLADFILVGGMIFTLMILFILAKRKNRELPHNLLILFFLFPFFIILFAYADLNDSRLLFMIAFPFDFSSQWILAPLLFLYIKSLFYPSKGLVKKHLFHFAPALIFTVAITIPLLICFNVEKCMFKYLEPVLENQYLLGLFRSAYLVIYLLLSLKLFHKSRALLKSNFSTLSENDFRWVRNMVMGALAISVIDLFVSFFYYFNGETDWDAGYITVVGLVVVIGYLGYYGISQSRVLLPDFLFESIPQKADNSKETTTSKLPEKEVSELQIAYERVFQNKKPYLDPDLNLTKLAELMSTSDKKLSGFLNQHLEVSFYDLINRYRVEEVKKKINDPEYSHFTLLALALDSGFNSKTSFNRIFKKETGISPSQFKKQNS